MEQMSIRVGQEIPAISKEIAQEKINLFERSGGKHGPSFFTDAETARKTIGLDSPMASGRMSVSYALECLRRFFGDEIFNRSGSVDLRNLRPVRAGDTVTISGKVTEIRREANGQRVVVEISITNQKGDTTSAGSGSAIVPSGYLPVE
jgi:acyl dehydratase